MPDKPTELQLYEVYRKYMEHEDDLINHRTTWTLAAQSFLLVAYGLGFQSLQTLKMQALGAPNESGALKPLAGEALAVVQAAIGDVGFFIAAVAVAGLALSVLSFASVFGAHKALQSLADRWQTLSEGFECQRFPVVTGGGSAWASSLGKALPLLAPWVLFLCWTVLLVSSCFGIRFSFDFGLRWLG